MSSLPLPLLHPIGSPRKHRIKQRTALFALLALLLFACYVLFIAYPSIDLSQSRLTHVQDHRPPHAQSDIHSDDPNQRRPAPPHKAPQQLRPMPPPRPPLSLSPTEELAALAAFIAALPHNVIPSSVDPSNPLDPQLVLDFDPRSELAKEELGRVVEQVWSRFPVILFTKRHSSDSREIRAILSNMRLKPAPLVVEADQREDAAVLLPLLSRLTHVPSLPVLLIGGAPVGSGASDTKDLMGEVRRLHEIGELARRILEAGAIIVPERKKGKGKNPPR